MKRKIEILAPAGSEESLKAAVLAGADAVYIGGKKFGARAYADNLEEDGLLSAIDYVHIHGRKIYLTVNTLLKNSEMEELYEYLLPYYRRGLDAVIVQDIGVMEFIRTHFPGLQIHVSTQACVTGVPGARFFKERGASRIVPARELGLDEIRQMKEKTGLEIECFVHGALCYCYSGQCLMSSMIGGRSGNRGQCAQPCRLPYSCGEEKQKDMLSLKDLCTIEMIPQLIECGIDSFKIEGRMKQPDYVYTVVSMYRKYVDFYLQKGKAAFKVSKEDKKILEGSYQRRGYTDGYYKRHNGKNMISLSRPDGRTEEKSQIPDGKVKEKINGKLILFKEERVKLYISFRDFTTVSEGAVVQEAQKQPLERARVEKQMRKTGNTEFEFDRLDIEMDPDVFIPMQALNELRREGITKLVKAILEPYQRTVPETYEKETVILSANGPDRFSQKVIEEVAVLVTKDCQLKAAIGNEKVDTIYVESGLVMKDLQCSDNDAYQGEKAGTDRRQRIFLALPYIFRADAVRLLDQVYEQILLSFDGVLVRSWESIQWLKEHGYSKEIRTDYDLYVFNGRSKRALKDAGISRFTAPVELNYHELSNLDIRKGSLIVYGRQPVMVTANCVRKTLGTCTHESGMIYLTDRYQKKFAVKTECSWCYNVIHNCSPLLLLTQKAEVCRLAPAEIRLDFTDETEQETAEMIDLYRSSFIEEREIQIPDMDYTKGHFKRGVK